MWYVFNCAFQNVELCSTCYKKFGHEHAMRKYSTASRATAKSSEPTSDVIRRCIETVAHAASCTQRSACPRQPECRKMMDVLRHARGCAARTSCTVCQQLMALCVTHARSCATDSPACNVPFCAELRRHMQRRLTLQRHQQHQMDDRRRALTTGSDEFIHADDHVETQPSDCTNSHHSTGKERPLHSITGVVSATGSHPAAVTIHQDHPTTNPGVLRRDNYTLFSSASEKSTSVTSALKTSDRSVSQTSGDLTSKSTSCVVNSPCSSAPKTAVSGVADGKFTENSHSAGDGPKSEVLQTTESSARHQIVVGCLRVLKKLHPSMSKQNLLQILCHCSRQQLTALQDKVHRNSF